MSATVVGTAGEDRSDYTKDESRVIRRRSLRLLGSLISPLRWQVALAGVVLVVSTALQVAGPALIAYGIDTALPAVLDEANWMPTIGVVAVYPDGVTMVPKASGIGNVPEYSATALPNTQAVLRAIARFAR